MEFKSFDILLKAVIAELEEKKTDKTNPAGIAHANELVAAGKVSKPSSWNHPTTQQENDYIDANGIEAYAKWNLGINSQADPKSKDHYHYIYTSDFKTVDRAGLIAIRQRSAQQGMDAIFTAAGKMLDKIDAAK
jgi:maleate cis-trans isomerase